MSDEELLTIHYRDLKDACAKKIQLMTMVKKLDDQIAKTVTYIAEIEGWDLGV